MFEHEKRNTAIQLIETQGWTTDCPDIESRLSAKEERLEVQSFSLLRAVYGAA